ncbi:unnamed protein product [Darwinula stevensoni]|uniref:Uncharacterized protein n=1 Tax=Darwinula stevensoni TaxID=69355 RepID=A0A7R9A437_9CRUS|nr:unnamed protein product [Darwinula stevensoni]CAG0892860.1 unnamed protein product [Darwinula stevensoni]
MSEIKKVREWEEVTSVDLQPCGSGSPTERVLKLQFRNNNLVTVRRILLSEEPFGSPDLDFFEDMDTDEPSQSKRSEAESNVAAALHRQINAVKSHLLDVKVDLERKMSFSRKLALKIADGSGEPVHEHAGEELYSGSVIKLQDLPTQPLEDIQEDRVIWRPRLILMVRDQELAYKTRAVVLKNSLTAPDTEHLPWDTCITSLSSGEEATVVASLICIPFGRKSEVIIFGRVEYSEGDETSPTKSVTINPPFHVFMQDFIQENPSTTFSRGLTEQDIMSLLSASEEEVQLSLRSICFSDPFETFSLALTRDLRFRESSWLPHVFHASEASPSIFHFLLVHIGRRERGIMVDVVSRDASSCLAFLHAMKAHLPDDVLMSQCKEEKVKEEEKLIELLSNMRKEVDFILSEGKEVLTGETPYRAFREKLSILEDETDSLLTVI